MRKPMVHLNGTSGQALFEQVLRVKKAVDAANTLMTEAWPNPRDYYVQEIGAFSEAVGEWRSRAKKLREVSNDMQIIGLDIDHQIRERGE